MFVWWDGGWHVLAAPPPAELATHLTSAHVEGFPATTAPECEGYFQVQTTILRSIATGLGVISPSKVVSAFIIWPKTTLFTSNYKPVSRGRLLYDFLAAHFSFSS